MCSLEGRSDDAVTIFEAVPQYLLSEKHKQSGSGNVLVKVRAARRVSSLVHKCGMAIACEIRNGARFIVGPLKP